MAGEYEKLARAVKGTVKVAYWDTQQHGDRPKLLGDIKGTPTIRLYKPKRNQGDSSTKKIVVDYTGDRTARAMKDFLDYQMPSYIEHIGNEDDLKEFLNKADRHGLPGAILFTSKAKTASLTKYLSTEFRRRLLLGQAYPTKPNGKLMERYGITELPALIVLPAAATTTTTETDDKNSRSSGGSDGSDGRNSNNEPTIIHYDGGSSDFTKNKLQSFLSKHALNKKVPIRKKNDKEKVKEPSTGGGGHSEF